MSARGVPIGRVRHIAQMGSIVVAGLFAVAAAPAWNARTPWGDPDLHGEWTTEGEYGVPFERPAQYGTRQLLTDEEYAKRMQDIRVRDEQDLERVDVLSGPVRGAGAPIPHWRECHLDCAMDGRTRHDVTTRQRRRVRVRMP